MSAQLDALISAVVRCVLTDQSAILKRTKKAP